MKPLTLFELNRKIRECIAGQLEPSYWVQAELSEVHLNRNGHCYVEFVQKEASGNQLKAKARGVIWSNLYPFLSACFLQQTGLQLSAGIQVLVEVEPSFHELYGYSLSVVDIDPTYTLGDLARRRKEILDRLAQEGVRELNKELEMPATPQRVAVISAATAAGYGDFRDQLLANKAGYVFYPRLFPAVMQGVQVEESIIAALDRIAGERDKWDVVVIIRGGGSAADLSGFDTYRLADNVAQFPIPVITGIGHERDDTVIDLVAHTRVKTPTAAAACLLARMDESAALLERYANALSLQSGQRLTQAARQLDRLAAELPALYQQYRSREERRVDLLGHRLAGAVTARMYGERHELQRLEQRTDTAAHFRISEGLHRLEVWEQLVMANAPERLLRRGYSMTLHEGHVVTDASRLKPGDRLVTRLAKGEVISEVQSESY